MKRFLCVMLLILLCLPLPVMAEAEAPQTYRAYVAEHDMATLSGILPEGAVYSELGFYWGESAGELTQKVKANRSYNGEFNKLITGLKAGTTYYFRAYMISGGKELQGEVAEFATLVKSEWSAEDAIFATPQERYRFLFDDDSRCPIFENPPKGYNGAAEAMQHIVAVSVPVWHITGADGRTASTVNIYINRKLAKNVEAIFTEIFEMESKYPINFAKGMAYRRINGLAIFRNTSFLSHHSFGTAIDVNYWDNLFYPVGHDGRNVNSPYYINQSVIDIFEKYGWSWGGYYLEGIDAMHFQYLGLDLMTQVNYVTPPCEDVRG